MALTEPKIGSGFSNRLQAIQKIVLATAVDSVAKAGS